MSVSTLRKDIESAINRHGAENGSNTPDYILAEYLVDCLLAFDKATRARDYAGNRVVQQSVDGDAARYRWLRDRNNIHGYGISNSGIHDYLTGGYADREIDRMMSEER